MFSKNRLITKPSRLTLGVAAATAAAVAGIAIGTTAGGSSSGHGLPAALNKAGVSKATPRPASSPAGQPTQHAGGASGPSHHAVPAHGAAKPARAAHHSAPAAKQTGPYLMYDSVIPSAIPRHHVAAVYATGPFATSPSAAGVAGRGGAIVWIDTRGTDPGASALDIEPGDATPSVAASWAKQRLSRYSHVTARLYTTISEWPAVKAAVAALNMPQQMQSRIRWWIADPNGVPHLVAGSDATQWYWGSTYDMSTVTPRF